MTDNLDQLRQVAERATPGPWHKMDLPEKISNSTCTIHAPNAEGIPTWSPLAPEIAGVLKSEDAIHITTFDPSTVLALINRAEAAEREAVAAKSVIAQHIVTQSFEISRTAGIAVDEAVRVIAKMLEADTDRRARDAEARAEAAEQAVERAKAVDALQRRDKGALYRRAEVAEGRLSAVGVVVDDLHATGAISQDAADQLTAALEGEDTP